MAEAVFDLDAFSALMSHLRRDTIERFGFATPNQQHAVWHEVMNWNFKQPQTKQEDWNIRVNHRLRERGIPTVTERAAQEEKAVADATRALDLTMQQQQLHHMQPAAAAAAQPNPQLQLDEHVMRADVNEETDATIERLTQDAPQKPLSVILFESLSDEQKAVFERVKAGHNVFITGGAGTGKSFLVRAIIAWLKEKHAGPCTWKESKEAAKVAAAAAAATAFASAAAASSSSSSAQDQDPAPRCTCFDCAVGVVGPTGLSVLPLRGRTINSFFGVGLGATIGEWDKKASSFHGDRMRSIDVLFCEEVSMVSAERLDLMDQRMRCTRGQPAAPFGGLKQVIFIGDFFQLAPVSMSKPEKLEKAKAAYDKFESECEKARHWLTTRGLDAAFVQLPFWQLKRAELQLPSWAAMQDSLNELYTKLPVREWGYAFQANVWRQLGVQLTPLSLQQRQQLTDDPLSAEFITRLSELRTGDTRHLQWFDRLVNMVAGSDSESLHLALKNTAVDKRNVEMLTQLARSEPIVAFPPLTLRRRIGASAAVHPTPSAAELIEGAEEVADADAELEEMCTKHPLKLCLGARVLLTRNMDLRPTSVVMLANGSRGTVVEWRSKSVVVQELHRFIDNMTNKMDESEPSKHAGQAYFIATLKKKLEFVAHHASPEHYPVVRFTNDTTAGDAQTPSARNELILPVVYELRDKYDEATNSMVHQWRFQLPLRLAWATTVHKSQGMTLDSAFFNNGTAAFSFGQMYVALSRVKSYKGLRLAKPLAAMQLWASEVVQRYYKGTLPLPEIEWLKSMDTVKAALQQG